ncbi:bifunctional acetate--CoA ligase family protein/GNAT family N-acetyltransferase [Methylopila sp. M107]|uniref:bifunctional acetate--CoA ligase family protein/GNAT family N-acetyltransferase n=1 Tax=Methylopila sp. M107 TaxID=1101190 RepID=UPI0003782E01|nr:bifunctional acetate--CoA ligase family protein/GNAT family N-acetyltransferase [Methylopila sp. M107]
MTVRNLDAVFAPRSVTLVGASPREGSVGRIILANLRAGDFSGPVALVNPDYPEIDGLASVPTLAALPEPPDLVIVTAPAHALPRIVDEAGAAGARAVVVVTLSPQTGGEEFRKVLIEAARRHGVRLVGPGCLGVQSPHVRLNASAAEAAAPGELALISQSGGVMSSTVAWANTRSIGFSGLVSLGDTCDVDVDDLLDQFAIDRRTRAILLYLDEIGDAPRFMSAARAAARIKPVVVVKARRAHLLGQTDASIGRPLVDADIVCDAAFRRAGLLRVADLAELFEAAETLAHAPQLTGKRVAIVSNSAALGTLALARLRALGGEPAALAEKTHETLSKALPSEGFAANPVDLCGDAGGARYEAALDAVLEDPGVDAAIAIHAPSRISPAGACAVAVAAATTRARARRYPPKPVFAAFLAAESASRRALEGAHVAFFRTPEAAVQGLMHLVDHVEAQASLLATPPSAPENFAPDVARARAAIGPALRNGGGWLSPTDVAEALMAYGVPTLPQAVVETPEEAAEVATALSGPRGAVVKIVSPDILRRALVGGVRLALESPNAVLEAARGMLGRAAERMPEARIEGFLVQPHIRPDDGQELYLGVVDDPSFGPVVAFGAGGGAAALRRDVAAALPPLHMGLARELIDDTIAGRLLGGHDDRPPVDRDMVALVLVKIAQLAVDLAEIREIEINPLVATPRGAVAFDARIRVAPLSRARGAAGVNPRLAIRPYPKAYETELTLKDGATVAVRPIRPEDEPAVAGFFRHVAPDDLRQRFFTPVVEVPRAFIARLTQIDYARAFVLLAVDGDRVVGLAQLHADPDVETGEYAILLGDGEKGRGLGRGLMRALIDVARAEGLEAVTGEVLTENTAMLSLCRSLGFEVKPDPDDLSLRQVRLALDPPPCGTHGGGGPRSGGGGGA